MESSPTQTAAPASVASVRRTVRWVGVVLFIPMNAQEENDVLKEMVAILAWRANYPMSRLDELVTPAKSNLNMRKKGELPPLEIQLVRPAQSQP